MTRKPDSMVTANTPATENEAWARLHHALWISTIYRHKGAKKLFMTKILPPACVSIRKQTMIYRKCWDSVWMIRPRCYGGKKGRYLKRRDCFLSLFVCFPRLVCLFLRWIFGEAWQVSEWVHSLQKTVRPLHCGAWLSLGNFNSIHSPPPNKHRSDLPCWITAVA